MEIVHDLESQANENSPADDKKLEPHELVQRAHHFANIYKGLSQSHVQLPCAYGESRFLH